MLANAIKKIERQYEIKRGEADAIFLAEKKAVYSSHPRLSEIDAEITKKGIESAKLSVTLQGIEKESAVKKLQDDIYQLKKEKESLLKNLNITLLPKYSCKKCNDTGYIVDELGISKMCSCMKQELLNETYQSSNMYNLKNQSFEKFNLNLFSDTPNVSEYKSSISPRENMSRLIQISKDFIQNFEKAETKNLLFTGTTGTGKTFLSSCIANELIKKDYKVLYQTAPVLLEQIFNYKYNNDLKNLYQNVLDVNLLIMDDLGTESMSSAKFAEIFTILNTRLLKEGTKTIISTNYSLEELNQMYHSRIVSRIIGNFHICRFFGNDLRLN